MNRILVILPHNPGDVIMGLHIVARLNQKYPEARVDFVTSKECLELVEGHPGISELFVLPAAEIKSCWGRGDMQSMLRACSDFLQPIKERTYDLSANLFQENFGALIQGHVNASRKIGFCFEDLSRFQVSGRLMEHLFAVPVRRSSNPWHVIDIYLKALDIDEGDRPIPSLPSSKEQSAAVEIPAGSVAFQIGSAWPGKRWPIIHWAALADKLLPHVPALVFLGAPEETGSYHQFEKLLPSEAKSEYGHKLINLIGRTSMLGSYEVLRKCRRLITGDTLTMHLGAAANTRVLALFGASNPVETGPYGNSHLIVRLNHDVVEKLPLTSPLSGLEKISAEAIAGIILKGVIPGHLSIWETAWDEEMKMQVLVNNRQELHPFLKQRKEYQQALFSGGMSPESPDAQAFSLLQLLDRCLQKPDSQNLQLLSEMDRMLAVEKKDSLVWEAYRIHINGLPLTDIKEYLQSRKRRLQTAVRELSLTGE